VQIYDTFTGDRPALIQIKLNNRFYRVLYVYGIRCNGLKRK